jgi:hypothetical protein
VEFQSKRVNGGGRKLRNGPCRSANPSVGHQSRKWERQCRRHDGKLPYWIVCQCRTATTAAGREQQPRQVSSQAPHLTAKPNKHIRRHRRRRLYSMKVIIILASLLAFAPLVRADEVVIKHEPTVVVHEHHHQNYHRHHYAHHDVIVEHPE